MESSCGRVSVSVHGGGQGVQHTPEKTPTQGVCDSERPKHVCGGGSLQPVRWVCLGWIGRCRRTGPCRACPKKRGSPSRRRQAQSWPGPRPQWRMKRAPRPTSRTVALHASAAPAQPPPSESCGLIEESQLQRHGDERTQQPAITATHPVPRARRAAHQMIDR